MDFLGFDKLEELEARMARVLPVYVLRVIRDAPAAGGGFAVRRTALLWVAQKDRALGVVKYCRVRLGSALYYERDFPVDVDAPATACFLAADSAQRVVVARLRRLGFEVVPALFATPQGLVLLDGTADCLAYDERGVWYEQERDPDTGDFRPYADVVLGPKATLCAA